MTNRRSPPWLRLWTQWADLAQGAPEVIQRRLSMIARQPLAPQTLVESQRMVLEKMVAAGEAWWALWQGAAAVGVRPRRGAGGHAVAVASRALQPASRRVKANVKRLRRRP